MSKRKQKTGVPDIVSETRQNSGWFLGYREHQPYMNMSPAEWAQFQRRQRGKQQRIISIIFLVILGVVLAFNLFSDQPPGGPIGGIALAVIAALIVYMILSIRRIGRK